MNMEWFTGQGVCVFLGVCAIDGMVCGITDGNFGRVELQANNCKSI